MSNILEIQNLTKNFRGLKAVNNVSFTVEEGCTGEVMTTNWIEMPAGMYNLTVAYTGGGDDVEIQFHNSDIEMGCIRLPADTRAVTVQAYVPTAQTQATLVVNTEGSGIQLESIVLEPSQAYGWFRLLRRFFLLLVLDFFQSSHGLLPGLAPLRVDFEYAA